jgi:hypothetical protein
MLEMWFVFTVPRLERKSFTSASERMITVRFSRFFFSIRNRGFAVIV